MKTLKKGDAQDEQDSLADITQAVTYYWPEKAFQIFCVKHLQAA